MISDFFTRIWGAIKLFFGSIDRFFRMVRMLGSKVVEWSNWAVLGIIGIFKGIWDFIVVTFNDLITNLNETDLSVVSEASQDMGGVGQVWNALQFFNCIVPLDEIFIWANFLIVFTGACWAVAGFYHMMKLIRG